MDQNLITQNLCHVKDYRIFEEKRNLKAMSKGGYVLINLAFIGWWSIFLVVTDILWLLVNDGG